MPDIIHSVGIKGAAKEIYEALTTNEGLSKWWTTDTMGSGELGSVIQFRFDGEGPDFEVVELKPDVFVRWKHVGEMPKAWMGTEVSFRLQEEDGQIYVLFKHGKWKEASDFMAHCSTKWAVFLISLKVAVETGIGKPFPNDTRIDHSE